ncbi:MAG: hypothetical protein NTX44_07380 [Ignavibacteriales bacterium]|nr:hypothetical protein [Ignavibacteriales bacterium]
MKLNKLNTSTVILLILALFGSLRAQSREGSAFDQSKFVPDIAFILDVSGVARNIADQKYFSLTIPGLSYPFLNQTVSSGLNAHRGMNFNYGEMSLYSVVDPYFDLFAVIGLSPDGAGLEEAYFTTRKLPYGFQLKAGKFLASFGRINEQHEHYWDFANRPLVATALFGEDGLKEIGAQATWVAPTSFYLVLGVEVLNGANEQSFGTAGFSDPKSSVAIDAAQGPNLFIGYIRSSFDIDDASILFGISNAIGTTRTDQDFSSSGGAGEAVNANTDIVGGDLTVKYSLDAIRYLSFQSEYMYRVMNGTEYVRDSLNAVSSSSLDKYHSGFYAQVVAKLDQLWRVGVRYDLLMQNDVSLAGADQHMPSNLPRYSAMIEYSPTEFSRLRLQIDRDLSRYVQYSGGWSQQPYTQVILQANLTIGAHGAHAF